MGLLGENVHTPTGIDTPTGLLGEKCPYADGHPGGCPISVHTPTAPTFGRRRMKLPSASRRSPVVTVYDPMEGRQRLVQSLLHFIP